DRQRRLLRGGRRVAGGYVRPAGRGREGGDLVGEPERGRARLLVGDGGRRQHAAGGEEGGEVDRRAGDVGVGAAHPLDLGDLLAGPLGGGGDRVRLQRSGRR